MQVGHQARIASDEREQSCVDLGRVDGRQAQTRKLGNLVQDLTDQVAQRRRSGEIRAPAGQVNSGEHHLGKAGGDQAAHLTDDRLGPLRARVSTAIGNDAKGAAVVAAGLDRYIGPGAAGEARYGGYVGAFGHDVAHPDP